MANAEAFTLLLAEVRRLAELLEELKVSITAVHQQTHQLKSSEEYWHDPAYQRSLEIVNEARSNAIR